jgi:hypothetical protein
MNAKKASSLRATSAALPILLSLHPGNCIAQGKRF